jgi:D-alanyl-D-alanine carboxypeptidase (penicillin-binding protein 5/6)
VAVAEHIAGTVDAFLDLMNDRAKTLNMQHTHFASVHGLPASNGTPGDLTSAHDLAILARELIKYPEILTWGAIKVKPAIIAMLDSMSRPPRSAVACG